MACGPTIPDEEYATLVREHGTISIAWEYTAQWLAWWRDEHPDDDRHALDILLSPDFQKSNGAWAGKVECHSCGQAISPTQPRYRLHDGTWRCDPCFNKGVEVNRAHPA